MMKEKEGRGIVVVDTFNVVEKRIQARLSKSGSYVGSLKVGEIVDRRIGS